MSFYKKEKNDKTLIISDDAIDELICAFKSISEIYLENVDRKPNLSEIEEIMSAALEWNVEELFGELEDKEISECKFKVRKKRAKVLYQPGTVFSIFVPGINKYSYALMVKGQNIKKPYDEDTYLEYYSLFTDNRISLNEFKKYYSKEKSVLFTASTGWTGWLEGNWKKIGQLSIDIFDPNHYQLPDFVSTNNGKYFLSRGRANIALINREIISKEEAVKISNPGGILGHEIIEELLLNRYKNPDKIFPFSL